MTDIAPARRNIQIEEVQYRASVSEFTANAIGGAVNFINEKQYDSHRFQLNGTYSLGAGSTGTDGAYICLFNMQILAISIFHGRQGTSGTTTLDIHWLSGGSTDEGTIFSSKPTINSSAVDNSYSLYDVSTASDIVLPTGFTSPSLSKSTFNQGEALRFDLDTAMSGAKDVNITIHFRPIN